MFSRIDVGLAANARRRRKAASKAPPDELPPKP